MIPNEPGENRYHRFGVHCAIWIQLRYTEHVGRRHDGNAKVSDTLVRYRGPPFAAFFDNRTLGNGPGGGVHTEVWRTATAQNGVLAYAPIHTINVSQRSMLG
jgi:hypothetical protein